jgi:hypothetical protein
MKKEIAKAVHDEIMSMNHTPDMTDYGNQIGCAIGKYLSEKAEGWQKDDFMSGLEHGLSLQDGTHDTGAKHD